MKKSSDVDSMLGPALGLEKGELPFPWQRALLERFAASEIPPSLDLPTGLGKTSVMAIWLLARAAGARLPRRLVYVVDRRVVVDQATDEAERLRTLVSTTPELKEALGIRSDETLSISTLRGQHVDSREWLEDPTKPAIIVGTVDMIGSRLLFQGYGVSRRMRPYHAGLLGVDTFIVLDEAHLVLPFEALLRDIETGAERFGPRDSELQCIVPAFRLLSLSATGRHMKGAFRLAPEDHKHPIVAKRLHAEKALDLHTLKSDESLSEALANEAWKLTKNGSAGIRCLVFCNARKAAEDCAERLRKLGRTPGLVSAVEVELLVGGRRVFERTEAQTKLRELGFLAGSSGNGASPAFLVATSAGEVGVDLDADHMVCDLVTWERMIQRLGRVNRRGEGSAKIRVLIEPPPAPTKAQEQAEARKASGRELSKKDITVLENLAEERRKWKANQAPFQLLPKQGRSIDVSPLALTLLKESALEDEKLNKIIAEATTKAPLRPALSRPLIDSWAMTSAEYPEDALPEIAPWLRGWIKDDPPQTRVLWRKYLPLENGGEQFASNDIQAFFEAAPPHLSEVLEVETYRVLDWLTQRAKTIQKTPDRAASGVSAKRIIAIVLSSAGKYRSAFSLQGLYGSGEQDRNEKKWKDSLHRNLSGATLILDARFAGLSHGLLDPSKNEPPPTVDSSTDWVEKVDLRFRVREVDAEYLPEEDSEWRESLRLSSETLQSGDVIRWLLVEKRLSAGNSEESRSSGPAQLLEEHQAWTESKALELAARMGLNPELTELLTVAAAVHDEGKRAPRWQRAFNSTRLPDGIYAKTLGPINFQLLDHYRHEFGSLKYAAENERLQRLSPELRELALHLIASHHGFARPVIRTDGCDDAPPSVLRERSMEVALRFSQLQKQWGVWGLAWWEALLRSADYQASEANEKRTGGAHKESA